MTRWATKDMCGRLIEMFEEQGRKYRLITKKALDEEKIDNTEIKNNFEKYNITNSNELIKLLKDKKDLPKEEKEIAYNIINKGLLNPKKVLKAQDYINVFQTLGEEMFEANYNQIPIDKKGALYSHFMEYDPADIQSIDNSDGKIRFTEIRARADVADEGDDYLSMIIYGVTKDKQAYVLDIYYTQAPMEETEPEAARRLLKHNVNIFRPESNNGGRGWSRSVRSHYEKMGGIKCTFKPYTQTMNKEARILSNATDVMNIIHFPYDWKQRWRDYYISMRDYQRQGKNEHDDAQDCTTSIAEELTKNNQLKGA